MRRDILLGALLAAFLHLSVAVCSHLTRHPAPFRAPLAKVDPIQVALLPVEPPDIGDDTKDEPVVLLTPVPVSPDPIQTPDLKDFVIPPDPPSPTDPRPAFAVYTIPANVILGSRRPFTLNEVDQAPQTVLQGPAAYPAAMKAQHLNGEVVVRFVVDASNNVRDVRVVSSSQREFESAAIQAVQKWKFKAGQKGGKPVPVQLEVPIRFNLK